MEYFATRRKSKNNSSYLLDFIKKKVDLAEFIENETGSTLEWLEENVAARTLCPMPGHDEKKPSFRVRVTEDDVWIYHCFGCGAKGTIIDFCMEFFGLDSISESILFICNKFGFKNSAQLVTDSLKDVKKKMNRSRKLECAHIVSASQCRSLLRRNYEEHSKWVNQAYRKMNIALDEENIDGVEAIGFEASSKLR